jgi:hypothetical protein
MLSDEASLRVGQLGSAGARTRFACTLRGAVESADRSPDPLRLPPSLIRRGEIRASGDLLIQLAERLSTSEPLGVEALAMTSLLVGDGCSPLYHADATRSLAVAAFEALIGLNHGHLTAAAADK